MFTPCEWENIPKPIEGEFGGVLWTEDYPLDKPAKFYKTCECYLYQCAESDDIENSPLFAAVVEMQNQTARVIVSRLPEYQEAEWE